jgi:sulfotransferase
MATIHFISGLPRSGSTLLAGLFGALLGEMSARNEFSVFIDDAKRERILRGLFDNFYSDCTAEAILDTNRFWCGWMPAVSRLFPDAKVIACVRDLPWVVDSIERLIQRNVFSPSSIFNYSAGGTVYTRAKSVVAPEGMVGGPYDALKQACYGAQRDRLMLMQDETLTSDPAKTMDDIYGFLGEPVFDHDFGHVDYDVTEFDERAGTPGLHTVRGTVKAEPRETLLPPDLFNRFVRDAFWRDPQRVPAGLRVV